jgi:hypothetical protein
VLGSEGLASVTCTRVLDDGAGTLTELTLGNVDLSGRVVGGRTVDSVEVAVVGGVLDIDVGVGVRRLGLEAGLGTLGLAVTRLLVDVNLFAVLRQRLGLGCGLRATALFLVDADFFLDVRVANGRLLGLVLVLVLVDGGSEGFVCLFVPFPSVCLRLR